MFTANEPHRDNILYLYQQGQKVHNMIGYTNIKAEKFHATTKVHDGITAKLTDGTAELGDMEHKNKVAANASKEIKSLEDYCEKMSQHLLKMKADLQKKLIWG